ncbi:MAG: IclR family transcriptional regulator [Acidobacteria bacterium]|nr:IclR family transcriptional regulator [Acidobacteriota bacterium]
MQTGNGGNTVPEPETGDAVPAKPAYLVPAVDRAFRILQLLKQQGREMTLMEIAKATGWHKSSIHKLLVTMNHHGILERDPLTKKYCIGITMAEYGRIALNNLDIRVTAKPFLKELVDYSSETAVLAILKGTKMIMIDKREPFLNIRVSPFIGMRFPATATSNGKALLAWLPEDKVRMILQIEGLPRSTSKSIVDAEDYSADLADTRRRGYAVDREEFYEGVSAVAAPVFTPGGKAIATLSIVGPEFRMTDEKIRDFGNKCVELAAKLSDRLR